MKIILYRCFIYNNVYHIYSKYCSNNRTMSTNDDVLIGAVKTVVVLLEAIECNLKVQQILFDVNNLVKELNDMTTNTTCIQCQKHLSEKAINIMKEAVYGAELAANCAKIYYRIALVNKSILNDNTASSKIQEAIQVCRDQVHNTSSFRNIAIQCKNKIDRKSEINVLSSREFIAKTFLYQLNSKDYLDNVEKLV